MSKAIGFIIVIAILAVVAYSGVGGKVANKITGDAYADAAGRRTTAILKDMSEGRNAESHLGATLWARNVRSMDQGELDAAHRAFLNFRRLRSFDGPFRSHRIISSEEVQGEAVKTALVTFEVDGKTHRWLVPESTQIRWAPR
ncbi:MAG TPA: hypothetical protein VEO54_11550 [Thermoanaerobaculia bacterium]|nr:hypothetical protein [Thermoanaerobaculia bacterium]